MRVCFALLVVELVATGKGVSSRRPRGYSKDCVARLVYEYRLVYRVYWP